jgi:hypothetical protein
MLRRRWALMMFVLSLGGCLLGFASPAHKREGVGIRFAVAQPGAAVRILSTKSTLDFLYEEVAVQNVSDKTVVFIRFGILLSGVEARTKPILLTAHPIRTNLKPGQGETLKTFELRPEEAMEKGRPLGTVELNAELGVLAVKFSDGSSWKYDFERQGGFQPAAVSPREIRER